MVKKYDLMVEAIKKYEREYGSIRADLSEGKMPMKNHSPTPIPVGEYFFQSGFYRNAYFILNSPYNSREKNFSLSMLIFDEKKFLENNFEIINLDEKNNSLMKLLSKVDTTLVKRYEKNPEQCYIKSMVNRSIERMGYILIRMIYKKIDMSEFSHHLRIALDEILFCLVYGSIKHSLAFHDKWNKVGRYRNSKKEAIKFASFLKENTEPFSNLVSISDYKSSDKNISNYLKSLNKNDKQYPEKNLSELLEKLLVIF